MFGLASRLFIRQRPLLTYSQQLGNDDDDSGQDPKLEFRKPGAGISLLASKTIAQDDPYWSQVRSPPPPSSQPSDNPPGLLNHTTQYWLLFDSPTDVITLIDSSTLSLILHRHPENLISLINVLATHLFTLLSTPAFPGTPTPTPLLSNLRTQAGLAPSSSSSSSPSSTDTDLAKEALNCIRVLSRVVPFLLRPQTGQGEQLEETVFWTTDKVRVEKPPVLVPTKQVEPEEGQFVIDDDEDEDEEEENGDGEATPTQEHRDEWEDLPPLATRLLSALVDLAFVPGFTVAEESRTPDGAVAYVIWEPGIAAPTTNLPPTSQSLLSNRLEVLRLLNLLLSLPSLLTPPSTFPSLPNRWRDALISGTTLEKKVIMCLLCSVLNTACAVAVTPSGGPFGLGGAFGAAEKLGGVVLRREDVKGFLTGACLQLLAILLTEHAVERDPAATDRSTGGGVALASPFTEPSPRLGVDPPPPTTTTTTTTTTTADPTPHNTFSFYLSKLHRRSDFDFILAGIFHILNQSLNQPLLPGVPLGGGGGSSNSGSKAGWALEALVVLWRMIEYNPKLLNHLTGTEKGGELAVYLVTFCLEFKDDETHLGLVRLSAFILQTLTAESRLATCANAPVDLKLSFRGKYNVPGTLADFIIVSIYTLIFTTKARLASLYPAFVLTIDNLSPYLKNLSSVSSTRLLQLFLAFSAPSFLLMEEGNPRLVFYMLETINNLIHFQLSDVLKYFPSSEKKHGADERPRQNPHTIYAIIRAYKRFEDLSTFTLAGGIAEARRIKRERKAAVAAAALPPTSLAPTPTSEQRRKSEADEEKESETELTEMTSTVPSPSPTPAQPATAPPEDSTVSEKARGKMRARNASVSSLPIADLGIGAGVEDEGEFVGKNGFIPTESWVASWREGLPLDSILIMLAELRPKVLEAPMTAFESDAPTEFLKSASLAGHLPPAPTPRPRRFIYTPQSITWVASLVYGSVYLNALELLRDVPIQLFAVAQARRGSSAVDLVNGAASFMLNRVGRNGSMS